MTVKETMDFIKRKYETKINKATENISKEINEKQTENHRNFDKFKQKMSDFVTEKAKEEGFKISNNITVSIYTAFVSTDELEELRQRKKEIVSALEKEKEQFLDEIMILGVKDETIKEKLKKLLEI